jgi:predicted Zn-dependent protease
MAARVILAVAALAAMAWLGVSLRGYDRFADGERLAFAPGAKRAQFEQAARLFEDARFLNPDTRPLLSEGSLLVARGDRRRRAEGLALLEEAVRREPDNVVAWAVLASATRRADPERSRAARARADELSPPVPSE